MAGSKEAGATGHAAGAAAHKATPDFKLDSGQNVNINADTGADLIDLVSLGLSDLARILNDTSTSS